MTTKYCPKCDTIVVVKDKTVTCDKCQSKLKELTDL